MSPCGREMNYIHCDDLPIVFNQLLKPDKQAIEDITNHSKLTTPTNDLLSYGGTNTLTVPFQPEKLVMFPESGRVYHSGPVGGAGLVKSSLALELSQCFLYRVGAQETDQPYGFHWRGKKYQLDNTLLKYLVVK